MTSYSGGAHAAELIATDGAGKITKKAWTINVDPKGDISAGEAIDTLEARDETAESAVVAPTDEVLESAEIEAGLNPAFDQTGTELESTGVPDTTTLTTDASDGYHIEGPESELDVVPIVNDEEGNFALTEDVAAVHANAGEGVDSIIRPEYNGAMVFEAIREVTSPDTFSWRLTLGKNQSLVSVNGEYAEVRYSSGVTSFLITAPPAHDATGAAVPTALSVEGNVLTLHVSHKSATFIYPVEAGQSFETGYESATLYVPLPPNSGEIEDDGFTVEGPPSGSGPFDPRTTTPRYWLKQKMGKDTTFQPAPEYNGPSHSAVGLWAAHACSEAGCDHWETWLSGSYLKEQYIKQSWRIQRWYAPNRRCEINMGRGLLNFPYANFWKVDAYEWFGPEIVTSESHEHLGAWCHYRLQAWPVGTEIDGKVNCLALQAWIWPNGWVTEIRRKFDWNPPYNYCPPIV